MYRSWRSIPDPSLPYIVTEIDVERAIPILAPGTIHRGIQVVAQALLVLHSQGNSSPIIVRFEQGPPIRPFKIAISRAIVLQREHFDKGHGILRCGAGPGIMNDIILEGHAIAKV